MVTYRFCQAKLSVRFWPPHPVLLFFLFCFLSVPAFAVDVGAPDPEQTYSISSDVSLADVVPNQDIISTYADDPLIDTLFNNRFYGSDYYRLVTRWNNYRPTKVRDTTDSMLLMQAIGSLFCIARPVYRGITLTEPSADSESRIADTLRFGSIFSWKFYYMPAYFRYFDSLSMPPRPDIRYEEVDDDPRYLRGPLYNFIKDVIEFVRFKADSIFKDS